MSIDFWFDLGNPLLASSFPQPKLVGERTRVVVERPNNADWLVNVQYAGHWPLAGLANLIPFWTRGPEPDSLPDQLVRSGNSFRTSRSGAAEKLNRALLTHCVTSAASAIHFASTLVQKK